MPFTNIVDAVNPFIMRGRNIVYFCAFLNILSAFVHVFHETLRMLSHHFDICCVVYDISAELEQTTVVASFVFRNGHFFQTVPLASLRKFMEVFLSSRILRTLRNNHEDRRMEIINYWLFVMFELKIERFYNILAENI